MNLWEATKYFMGDYTEPRLEPNNNRWQHRTRGIKCHKWEHWPHKKVGRKMAKLSRRKNRAA